MHLLWRPSDLSEPIPSACIVHSSASSHPEPATSIHPQSTAASTAVQPVITHAAASELRYDRGDLALATVIGEVH